jgi:hypothetical protein
VVRDCVPSVTVIVMNTGLIIAIALVLIIYLVVRSRGRSPVRTSPAEPPKASQAEVYQGLRNMVLHGTRDRFGLPTASTPATPWGVVMDWGIENGTATVMALSDGSASIYMSSGGGYIGGQKEEAIRSAAVLAVRIAGEFQEQMLPTTDYILPTSGEVIFYNLTDAGVFTVSGKEAELRAPGHPLAKLGNAMQNIITQYRILEDWKK